MFKSREMHDMEWVVRCRDLRRADDLDGDVPYTPPTETVLLP